MYGVAAEQARALDEVVARAAAHDDGAQAQAVAVAGMADEDASEQAPDAAESVEHNVGAVGRGERLDVDQAVELGAEVGVDIDVGTSGGDGCGEPRDVQRRRAGLDDQERIEHSLGLLERELLVAELASTLVRLDDAHCRKVDDAVAVYRGHDAVVAVEPADQRDQSLGELFACDPGIAVIFIGRGRHGSSLGTAQGDGTIVVFWEVHAQPETGREHSQPKPFGGAHFSSCRALHTL